MNKKHVVYGLFLCIICSGLIFYIFKHKSVKNTMNTTTSTHCSNQSRFHDKVVFITGGTSGIGLATAVQFAQEGAAQVIVCGRRESKWIEAQKYIQQHLNDEQRKVLTYWPCDVRVEAQVEQIISKIFEKFGRLDVCFNNAGVQPGIISTKNSGFITNVIFDSSIDRDGSIMYRIPAPQPTSSAQSQDPQRSPTQTTAISPFCESEFATSCLGVLYCLKWEMEYIFKKQPKDLPVSIINTSSRNGVLPDAHRPLYAASKAFIISLTKSVSNQSAQRAVADDRAMVRVNSVSPGPIDTPLEYAAYGDIPHTEQQYKEYAKKAAIGVPMKRTGKPEEIAPTVLFLADPHTSSYITGSNICVDGGHTGSPLLCACE